MADTCITCNAPLGQESRDLDYRHCHDCRLCGSCGSPVNSIYSRYCAEHSISPVQCHDCLVDTKLPASVPPTSILPETVTINRAEYELLNLCRRICTPLDGVGIDTNQQDADITNAQWISGWSHDRIIKHMRRMQSISASCMIVLKKARADIEREEKQMSNLRGTEFDQSAAREKAARNKKIEKDNDQSLSPLQRKQKRNFDAAVDALVKYGMDRSAAVQSVNRTNNVNKLMADKKLSRKDAEAIIDEKGGKSC